MAFCEYHDKQYGKDYCMLINEEIKTYKQYDEYCRRGHTKYCPIYKYWEQNKK